MTNRQFAIDARRGPGAWAVGRGLVCVAALLVAIVAEAQVRPVLTIAFDADLDGTTGEEKVHGTPIDEPSLEEGKFGRALKSGPSTGYLDYPTEGVLSPESGTVEMWVCPIDWRPEDNEFHVFLDVRGEGALYLYKFHEGVRLMMLACAQLTGPYFVSDRDLDWQPGEWHHLAGTWSRHGVMAYVDGQPAGEAPLPASRPKGLGATLRIGDHPWHLPRTSSSLIDEVRIYDRALSPAHVAAHSSGDYDFVAPLTPEGILIQCEPAPLDGRVGVAVSTGGADVEDARISAQVAVVPTGDPLPANAPNHPFADGQSECSVDLPADPGANYEAVAGIRLDGRQFTETRSALIVPETPWLGNQIGLEDKVLPPWTPVEVDGQGVSCWGREYTLADTSLLEQVRSSDAPLLARPVNVRVAAGGDAVRWVSGEHTREVSEAKTRLTSTGEFAGRLAERDVRLGVRRTVEYDGLMLVELWVPENVDLGADEVSIEIPLEGRRVIYRHRWAPSWAGVTGDLPQGDGPVDQSAFIPYYWLGDNDRGLFWFCESDEMWPNGEAANAVEVVRSEEEVVLRLNIMAPGQTLPPDWRLVFGLQATPVKPLPKDWRKWQLTVLGQPGDGSRGNADIIWPTPEQDSLRYYGYPEATDPELFSQRAARLQERGAKVVPYLCLSFLSAACEEWPLFKRHWSMGPVDSGSADVAAYGAGFAMASPSGKGYSDFIVWKCKQFIDRYAIDGVYHDNTHPYPSANLEAGVGYVRDGTPRRTFPILAYRDLYRRIYTVIKDLPRETFTMAHMSGKVTIPILATKTRTLTARTSGGRCRTATWTSSASTPSARNSMGGNGVSCRSSSQSSLPSTEMRWSPRAASWLSSWSTTSRCGRSGAMPRSCGKHGTPWTPSATWTRTSSLTSIRSPRPPRTQRT
ncbi:MAG TPA: DUF6067 family protein [Armatimonadota bacterium]|nr:DUF6067 family protein [Armatimonadota bacterium]